MLETLIATLASNGLNLLAGAVASKGQQVIEEKLGVKLDNPIKDAEDVKFLKQLEMQHEEFLLDIGVKQAELSLEEKKADYAEVDSARKLGISLANSSSWLNQNIVPVLALIVTFGGSWMLMVTKDADTKMAAVSMITMVLGYYFGTSIGSKDKQRVIEGLSK